VRREEISRRVRMMLLTGSDWEWLGPDLGEDLDPEMLAAAWKALRSELVAEHVRENPGTRPWAWWEYEAPGPRQQINPGPEPEGPADWYGMPHRYDGMPPSNMYEPEADYLSGHGLLMPAERLALTTHITE
jgi:hypothetical protein